MAEVSLNGIIVTLRRNIEVDQTTQRIRGEAPMYIYLGNMDKSLSDTTVGAWQLYGYRSSSERRSFSNVLFRMLDIPEMKAESNVTMHQILRLIYVDQESPTSSLFYYEKFDKEIMRDTIADLLLGVYDETYSQKKLEHISISGKIKEMKEAIRIANDFIGKGARSSAYFNDIIEKTNSDIQSLTQRIMDMRAQSEDNHNTSTTTGKNAEYISIQSEVEKARKQCVENQSRMDYLNAEIKDSVFFVENLQKKLDAIDRSIATRDVIRMSQLQFCPVCLSPLDNHVEEGHCKLCKSPVDDANGRVQATRMKLEIEHQMSETKRILETDNEELQKLKAKSRADSQKLKNLQLQFDSALSNVRSSYDDTIDQLLTEKGYKQGELTQYYTLLEKALQYEQMIEDYNALEKEKADLEAYITAKEEDMNRQRKKILRSISDNGVGLLNKDHQRQEVFSTADKLYVDFKQNLFYVTDKTNKLSASSEFYLKMTARFAIFLSSLQNENMRYPRLLLSDNMEDKGLEDDRAHRFQRNIVARLNEMPTQDYQVIFATSMIAEELNTPDYVVGETYTENNKVLKNV